MSVSLCFASSRLLQIKSASLKSDNSMPFVGTAIVLILAALAANTPDNESSIIKALLLSVPR